MSDIGNLHIKTTVDIGDAASASAILSRSLSQLTTQIASYSAAAQKASSVQSVLDNLTRQSARNYGILASKNMALAQATTAAGAAAQTAAVQYGALNKVIAQASIANPAVSKNLQAQATHLLAVSKSSDTLASALKRNALDQWAYKARTSLTAANRAFYSFSIATLPLVRGLRAAFFSMADLESQSARVTKLMLDNFYKIGSSSEDAFKKAKIGAEQFTEGLGLMLDKITQRYGTSRVLLQGIAGDFAELGVSTQAGIAGLVELTAAVEKLGNVDIAQSQKFVESVLQNILRIKREQGVNVDLTNIEFMNQTVAELTSQMAEFNLIENKTTLALKDIADAFPEVSAAATTFGLSMTETMAVLAPMVAAGFQVGASANSIKVSLQRMVAMTKQNTEIIGELNRALGKDFAYASGVGVENIQQLVDGFNSLLRLKGEQGTLELFARLFGVRQGPRMEVAIRQLAQFQEALSQTNSVEKDIAFTLEQSVNRRLSAINEEQIAVRNLVDISNLNTQANENMNGVLTQRAHIYRAAQKEAFDVLAQRYQGDFLSKVQTEAGKIFLSTGFRVEDVAGKQMDQELQIQLNTTIVQFRILKEAMLSIGRIFVTAFKPIIEFLNPIIAKVRDFLANMDQGVKTFLSFLTISALLIPGFRVLGTAVKYFGIAATATFSKMTGALSGTASKLITVQDLFLSNGKALKGYREAIQFTENSILLKGRNRFGQAGISGLSVPLQEKLAQAGLTPGQQPNVGVIKKLFKGEFNLPSSEAMARSIYMNIGSAVESSTAKAVGEIGEAAADATGDMAEAVRTALTDTVFMKNTFIGNSFQGGKPGSINAPGGPGGGPSAPSADTPPATPPAAASGGAPPPPKAPGGGRGILGRIKDFFGRGTVLTSSPDLSDAAGVTQLRTYLASLSSLPQNLANDIAASVPDITQLRTNLATGLRNLSEKLSAAVVPLTGAGAKSVIDVIDKTTIHARELVQLYTELGLELPEDLSYLRTLDKEFKVEGQSPKPGKVMTQRKNILTKIKNRILLAEQTIAEEMASLAEQAEVVADGSKARARSFNPNSEFGWVPRREGARLAEATRANAIKSLQSQGLNVTYPFADIIDAGGEKGIKIIPGSQFPTDPSKNIHPKTGKPRFVIKTRKPMPGGAAENLASLVKEAADKQIAFFGELVAEHVANSSDEVLARTIIPHKSEEIPIRQVRDKLRTYLTDVSNNIKIGFLDNVKNFMDRTGEMVQKGIEQARILEGKRALGRFRAMMPTPRNLLGRFDQNTYINEIAQPDTVYRQSLLERLRNALNPTKSNIKELIVDPAITRKLFTLRDAIESTVAEIADAETLIPDPRSVKGLQQAAVATTSKQFGPAGMRIGTGISGEGTSIQEQLRIKALAMAKALGKSFDGIEEQAGKYVTFRFNTTEEGLTKAGREAASLPALGKVAKPGSAAERVLRDLQAKRARKLIQEFKAGRIVGDFFEKIYGDIIDPTIEEIKPQKIIKDTIPLVRKAGPGIAGDMKIYALKQRLAKLHSEFLQLFTLDPDSSLYKIAALRAFETDKMLGAGKFAKAKVYSFVDFIESLPLKIKNQISLTDFPKTMPFSDSILPVSTIGRALGDAAEEIVDKTDDLVKYGPGLKKGASIVDKQPLLKVLKQSIDNITAAGKDAIKGVLPSQIKSILSSKTEEEAIGKILRNRSVGIRQALEAAFNKLKEEMPVAIGAVDKKTGELLELTQGRIRTALEVEEGAVKRAAAAKVLSNLKKGDAASKLNVLQRLLIEEQMQNILNSTDVAVQQSLQDEINRIKAMPLGERGKLIKNQTGRTVAERIQAQALRNLVEKSGGADFTRFMPYGDYDDMAENALLSNKKVVDVVRSNLKNMGDEGAELTRALDSMIAESQPAVVQARRDAAERYKQAVRSQRKLIEAVKRGGGFLEGAAVPFQAQVKQVQQNLTRAAAEFAALTGQLPPSFDEELKRMRGIKLRYFIERIKRNLATTTTSTVQYLSEFRAIFGGDPILTTPARPFKNLTSGYGNVVRQMFENISTPIDTEFFSPKRQRLALLVKTTTERMVQDMVSNLQKLIPTAMPFSLANMRKRTAGLTSGYGNVVREMFLPRIGGGSIEAGIQSIIHRTSTVGEAVTAYLDDLFKTIPAGADKTLRQIFEKSTKKVLETMPVGGSAAEKIASGAVDFRDVKLTAENRPVILRAFTSMFEDLQKSLDDLFIKSIEINKSTYGQLIKNIPGKAGVTLNKLKSMAQKIYSSPDKLKIIDQSKGIKNLMKTINGAIADAITAGATAVQAARDGVEAAIKDPEGFIIDKRKEATKKARKSEDQSRGTRQENAEANRVKREQDRVAKASEKAQNDAQAAEQRLANQKAISDTDENTNELNQENDKREKKIAEEKNKNARKTGEAGKNVTPVQQPAQPEPTAQPAPTTKPTPAVAPPAVKPDAPVVPGPQVDQVVKGNIDKVQKQVLKAVQVATATPAEIIQQVGEDAKVKIGKTTKKINEKFINSLRSGAFSLQQVIESAGQSISGQGRTIKQLFPQLADAGVTIENINEEIENQENRVRVAEHNKNANMKSMAKQRIKLLQRALRRHAEAMNSLQRAVDKAVKDANSAISKEARDAEREAKSAQREAARNTGGQQAGGRGRGKGKAAVGGAPVVGGDLTPSGQPSPGATDGLNQIQQNTQQTATNTAKTNENIIKLNKSLANVFKGPNLFQGPNIFEAPITQGGNFEVIDGGVSKQEIDAARKNVGEMTPRQRAAALKEERARIARELQAAKEKYLKEHGVPMPANVRKETLKGIRTAAPIETKVLQETVKNMSRLQLAIESLKIRSVDTFKAMKQGLLAVNQKLIQSIPIFGRMQSLLGSVAAPFAPIGRGIANVAKQFGLMQLAMLKVVATESKMFVASLARSRTIRGVLFFLTAGFSTLSKSAMIALVKLVTFSKSGGIMAGLGAAVTTLLQSITKTIFSFTALVVKVVAFGVVTIPIIIAVVAAVKALRGGITNMEPVLNNFKLAWKTIREALVAIFDPIKDFILYIAGIDQMETSTAKTAGVLYALSLVARSAADAFKRFAEGPLKSFIGRMREITDNKNTGTFIPLLTRAVNKFILIYRVFSGIIDKDSQKVKDSLNGLFYSLSYDALGLLELLVKGAANAVPLFETFYTNMAAVVIDVFKNIVIGVLYLMDILIQEMKKKISSQFGWIAKTAGAINYVLDARYLDFIFGAPPQQEKSILQDIASIADKAGNTLSDFMTEQDFTKNLANKIKDAGLAFADGIGSLRTTVANQYLKIFGQDVSVPLAKRMRNLAELPILELLKKATVKAKAGGEKLGGDLKKAIEKGMMQMKEEFGMAVFANADESVSRFIDNMKDSLERQKDKALEAFDKQVEAIQELADAEERLTAKMEYEERRRELIKTRALDRDNYLRERKVAAYEGRTEDVRELDLAFRKSDKDSEKELKDLDTDRRKQLQAQQREIAIAVINRQKEELVKQYDLMFKEFELRLDRIKARGFSTKDEFALLLRDLGAAGIEFSDDIAKTFEKSMLALPNAIREVIDPSIGMFSMTMDKLVAEATNKFGASIGTANASSILGAAYVLVQGLPDAFSKAFTQGIIAQYVTPWATAVRTEVAKIVPEHEWILAGVKAAVEMLDAMKREIRAKSGDVYDEFMKIFKNLETDLESFPGLADFFPPIPPDFDPFEELKKRLQELQGMLEEAKAKIVALDEAANASQDSSSGTKKPPVPVVTKSLVGKDIYGGKTFLPQNLPPPFYYDPADKKIKYKVTQELINLGYHGKQDLNRPISLTREQTVATFPELKDFPQFDPDYKPYKDLIMQLRTTTFIPNIVAKEHAEALKIQAATTGAEIANSLKEGFKDRLTTRDPQFGGGEHTSFGLILAEWFEDTIKSLIQPIIDKGRSIGESLKSGIMNGLGDPSGWSAFLGWWGRVVDTVKGIFGIQSPSTVFFSIGRNIMQGFINGIASLSAIPVNIIATAFGGVKTKIEEIASAVTTKWSTDISPVLTRWKNALIGEDALLTAVDNIKTKWHELSAGFQSGYDTYIKPTMRHIKDWLSDNTGLNYLVGKLKEHFGNIPDKFKDGWDTFVENWNDNVVGKLVGQLGNVAKSALGFVATRLSKFSRYYGGHVGAFTGSGPTPGFPQQGVPALLHGGEYVLNHKVVEKIGRGPLDELNNLRHGGYFKGGKVPGGKGGGIFGGIGDAISKSVGAVKKVGKGAYNALTSYGESLNATFINPYINLAGKAIGKNPNLRTSGLIESATNTADVAATILTGGVSKAAVTAGQVGLKATLSAMAKGSTKTSSELAVEKMVQAAAKESAKKATVGGLVKSFFFGPTPPPGVTRETMAGGNLKSLLASAGSSLVAPFRSTSSALTAKSADDVSKLVTNLQGEVIENIKQPGIIRRVIDDTKRLIRGGLTKTGVPFEGQRATNTAQSVYRPIISNLLGFAEKIKIAPKLTREAFDAGIMTESSNVGQKGPGFINKIGRSLGMLARARNELQFKGVEKAYSALSVGKNSQMGMYIERFAKKVGIDPYIKFGATEKLNPVLSELLEKDELYRSLFTGGNSVIARMQKNITKAPGVFTKVVDLMHNLNPLTKIPSRRIGIHVGRPGVDDFTKHGMMDAKPAGPGDHLLGTVYTWMKGLSNVKLVNKLRGMPIEEAAKVYRGLADKNLADRAIGFLEGQFEGKNASIYILQAKRGAKILRDTNLFASEARRFTGANVLRELNVSPELLKKIVNNPEEKAKAVAALVRHLQEARSGVQTGLFGGKFGKLKGLLGIGGISSLGGAIFGNDEDKTLLGRVFDIIQHDSKTSPLYLATEGVKKLFNIDQYKSQAGAPPRTLKDLFTGTVRYRDYIESNDPRYYNDPHVVKQAKEYYKKKGIKFALSKQQLIDFAVLFQDEIPDWQPSKYQVRGVENPLPFAYRTGARYNPGDKGRGSYLQYGKEIYRIFGETYGMDPAFDINSYPSFVGGDQKIGESALAAALRKSNNTITFVQDITHGVIGQLRYDQYKNAMKEIATLAGANYKIVTVKDATKFDDNAYITKNGLSYIIKITHDPKMLTFKGGYYTVGNDIKENEKYGRYLSTTPIYITPSKIFAPTDLIPQPIKEVVNYLMKGYINITSGEGMFSGLARTEKYKKSLASEGFAVLPSGIQGILGLNDQGHVLKHELMHAIFGAPDITTDDAMLNKSANSIMSYLNYTGELTKQDIDFIRYQLQGQILPKEIDDEDPIPPNLQRILDSLKYGKYKGGYIPKYKKGGFVPGAPSMPIPATLHGGEYVLNAESVRKIGLGSLERLNNLRHGGYFKGGKVPGGKGGGIFGGIGDAISNVVGGVKGAASNIGKSVATGLVNASVAFANLGMLFSAAEGDFDDASGSYRSSSASRAVTASRNPYVAATGASNLTRGLGISPVQENIASKGKMKDLLNVSQFIPVVGVARSAMQLASGKELSTFEKGLHTLNILGTAASGTPVTAVSRFDDVARAAKAVSAAKAGRLTVGQSAKIRAGVIAEKVGSVVDKIEVAKNYIPEVVNTLKGSVNPPQGNALEAGVKGVINNLIRADNIAIRNARLAANKAAFIANESMPPALRQESMPYRTRDAILQPGPITKAIEAIRSLNPLNLLPSRRIGIHVGPEGIKDNIISESLSGRSFGPGDNLGDYTYSWVRGKVEEIVNSARYYADDRGFAGDVFQGEGRAAKIARKLGYDLSPIDETSLPILRPKGSFYITKGGRLLEDINIPGSTSMRTRTQKILAEIPLDIDDMELVNILKQVRRRGGFFTKDLLKRALLRVNRSIKINNDAKGIVSSLQKESSKLTDVKNLIPRQLALPSGTRTTGKNLPALVQKQFNIQTKKVTGRSILPESLLEFSHLEGSPEVTESVGAYIHNILGETVGFGLSDDLLKALPDLRKVRNIPLNPLDITGTSKIGPNAVSTVRGWLEAHVGYKSFGGDVNDTYVSALLYAAKVKNNLQAQLEYARLVLEGKRLTAIEVAARNKPVVIEEQIMKSIQLDRGMRELTLDKLMAVHETSYPFEINEIGDAILRPTSDHYRVMNSDNNEIIRDTIHFALNHLVRPIMNRGSASRETGRLIAIKLKDLIDANPGAIENIMGVDTYFTPRPGEGLRFPAGKYEILDYKNLPIQNYTNEQRYALNEIFARLQGLDMRDFIPGQSFDEALENSWRTILERQKFDPDIGGHGLSSVVQTQTLWKIIGEFAQFQEYYIRMARHFDDFLLGSYSSLKNITKGQPYGMTDDLYGFENLLYYFGEGKASFNAFARIVGRDPFMQIGTVPVENLAINTRIERILIRRAKDYYDRFYRTKNQLGPIPLPSVNRKEGGYVPGAPSMPIPATLHGGEFVLNAEAVRKIGIPALTQLNKAKFSVPQIPSMRVPAPAMQSAGGTSSSTQNVNIYVDTFVGEPEWFNSMMKEYNTKVLPRNQKTAGLENRVIKTYTGLNRGV